MSNPQKAKGSRAEREVAAILADELGVPAKRALGAGRREDTGDVWGVPDTTVQVADWKDTVAALRVKVPAGAVQQRNAGARFGATFLRRRGGEYVVCMTVAQFCELWREAQ